MGGGPSNRWAAILVCRGHRWKAAMQWQSRMDVEEEERDEFRISKAQNIRKRTVKKASRSSTEPKRRRIAAKTSFSKSDERVAVTTQESSDGIREKAIREHRLARWSSPGRTENDRAGNTKLWREQYKNMSTSGGVVHQQ